ncbi:hypothetical protein [Anaerofustis sp.]|uniref:hypothetical protein n=1 Tax=Anaerofustis sp. TaxID=1872517 RepID=UPI0025BCF3F8|nr:hypothetical protein [Anaerofustis sp.]
MEKDYLIKIIKNNRNKVGENIAYINKEGCTFKSYIDGYKEAVDILYKQIYKNNNYNIYKKDTVVFPICFMYRHIVELYIKRIYIIEKLHLSICSSDNNDLQEDNIEKGKYEIKEFIENVGHDLKLSWNRVKEIIEENFSNNIIVKFKNNEIDFCFIDECIKELNSFDTGSFKNRYPINKEVIRTYCNDNESIWIDIKFLYDNIGKLYKEFDKIIYVIEEYDFNDIDGDFIKQFDRGYKNVKTDIEKFISFLEENNIKENSKKVFNKNEDESSYVDFVDIDCEESKGLEYFWRNEISEESLSMINFLYNLGKECEKYEEKFLDISKNYFKKILSLQKDVFENYKDSKELCIKEDYYLKYVTKAKYYIDR